MARKIQRVTITQEGRDKGKTFVITELPAEQAERWFLRALFALMQSRADISEETLQAGAAGIARIGLAALAGIPWETAAPLIDEMMTCVQFQPPNSKVLPLPLLDEHIEEPTVRLALRMAILELHIGFSVAEGSPTSEYNPSGETNVDTSATPTLLQSLAGLYRRMLRRL